jgi:ketosteroid isomerase-like protein
MPRHFLVAALLTAVACTPAREGRPNSDEATSGAGTATDTAASMAAIDSIHARFIDAYNRDDAAAIAALHTDSVRFISEGTVEEGRARLEEGWKNSLPVLSDLKITTLERLVSGDLATETIRFTQQYRNGGNMEVDSGYAVSVLRRDSNGEWGYHTHALSRVPAKR